MLISMSLLIFISGVAAIQTVTCSGSSCYQFIADKQSVAAAITEAASLSCCNSIGHLPYVTSLQGLPSTHCAERACAEATTISTLVSNNAFWISGIAETPG